MSVHKTDAFIQSDLYGYSCFTLLLLSLTSGLPLLPRAPWLLWQLWRCSSTLALVDVSVGVMRCRYAAALSSGADSHPLASQSVCRVSQSADLRRVRIGNGGLPPAALLPPPLPLPWRGGVGQCCCCHPSPC
jgi:hypothetical protein